MGGSLNELCAWAAALSAGDLPEDIARIARLQHLSLAGAARRLSVLPSGIACGKSEAGTLAAFLLFNFDDRLLGGRVGAAAVPGSWAQATGTVNDLIVATVVANELAGRAGLAGLLAHRPDQIEVRTLRVGAAVMRAKLSGGSAADLERAVKGAMGGVGNVPMSAAATVSGALSLARSILDASDGMATESTADAAPALDPWSGSGTVWLTRTLLVPRFPGTPWANVALEALDTILVRHLKAGEKRLRADQVERIELRTAFSPAATEAGSRGLAAPALGAWSIAEAFGVVVAHHELGPEWIDAGAAPGKVEEVAAVASRVEIVHDWRLNVRKGRAAAEALGPLLGEVGVLAVLKAAKPLFVSRPNLEGWGPMLGERPWAIVQGLLQKGGLPACTLEGAQLWPTDVKLYTTRGGWWPERRNVPTGGGESLEAAAKARYAHDTRADRLLSAPGAQPAAEWVAELLS